MTVTPESEKLLDDAYHWWMGSWFLFGLSLGLYLGGIITASDGVVMSTLIPYIIGLGCRLRSKAVSRQAIRMESHHE